MRRFIFLLLIFTTVLLNAVTMEVPAVTSDGFGTLTPLEISYNSNFTGVYVSIYPYSGESFQHSLRSAITFRNLSEYSLEHGLFARGYTNDSQGSIDGPSAGVALSLMLDSIIENRTLRPDITITGGISDDGQILPVGGLWEKYYASDEAGMNGFLVPPSDPTTRAGLCSLYYIYNTPVHEYSNYSYAKSLFFGSEVPSFYLNFTYVPYNLSNLTSAGENYSIIYDTVRNIIDGEFSLLNNSLCVEAVPYYLNKVNLAKDLLERGYVYSAGNEAFGVFGDIRLISNPPTQKSVKMDYSLLKSCLDDVNSSLKSCGDPMLYSQAELRYFWASDVYDSLNLSEAHSPISYMYDQLLLSRGILWCSLSQSILENCPSGELNPLQFQPVVEGYLLNSTANTDLAKAKLAYDRGLYGASLIEIAYSKSGEAPPVSSAHSSWALMLINHSYYLNVTESSSSSAVWNMAVWMDYLIDSSISNHSAISVSEPKDNLCNDLIFPAFIVVSVVLGFLLLNRKCRC